MRLPQLYGKGNCLGWLSKRWLGLPSITMIGDKMRMAVTPVSGFEYSTAIREFPVVVSIRLDAPALVSSRVDVCAALLTRVGSDEASFGYVRRALPIKRDFVESKNARLRFQLNIFEHDDDLRGFTPGEYRCDVKVEFYIKNEDANERIELEGGFQISLA